MYSFQSVFTKFTSGARTRLPDKGIESSSTPIAFSIKLSSEPELDSQTRELKVRTHLETLVKLNLLEPELDSQTRELKDKRIVAKYPNAVKEPELDSQTRELKGNG